MKTKKTISFKARVVALLLLCWVLPLVLIFGVNVNYMTSDRLQNKISKEIDQLRFSNHSIMQRLDSTVRFSREASYDKKLVGCYQRYRDGRLTEYEFMSRCFLYVRDHYSRDERILMGTLWFRENPDRLYCSTFNVGEGGTYADVQDYWSKDHEKILELSETLETRAKF